MSKLNRLSLTWTASVTTTCVTTGGRVSRRGGVRHDVDGVRHDGVACVTTMSVTTGGGVRHNGMRHDGERHDADVTRHDGTACITMRTVCVTTGGGVSECEEAR